ncbi:MAG: hypothetical protein EON86_07165, partial [Brevundimonas sp.]
MPSDLAIPNPAARAVFPPICDGAENTVVKRDLSLLTFAQELRQTDIKGWKMADLEAFRADVRAWLEENCPPEVRGPLDN